MQVTPVKWEFAGAELKKRCEAKLKEAEEKVAAITLDGEGQPNGLNAVEGL